MSKAELKQLLHEGIDNIESEYLLRKLYKVMEEEPDVVEEPIHILSAEEKRKLKQAEGEFARGEFYTNDEVEKMIDEWLEE